MRLPVILDESPNKIRLVKWGLVPHWDKARKMKPQINARLETAAEKQMFKDAYKKRRCLILADGFYEWKREHNRKTPFRFKRKNDKPFALAGIWDSLDDAEGNATFAILTTTANAVMKRIHDRMPIILPHGKENDWLIGGNYSDHLLQLPSKDLTAYEVSSVVNSPRNNRPEILEPVK